MKNWLADTQSVIRSGPHHELIMALIAQAYAQDACGISSDPSFALGGRNIHLELILLSPKNSTKLPPRWPYSVIPHSQAVSVSPILLPQLLPTVDCFVVVVFIVVVVIIVVVVSFSRILLPNCCQQLIVALLSLSSSSSPSSSSSLPSLLSSLSCRTWRRPHHPSNAHKNTSA